MSHWARWRVPVLLLGALLSASAAPAADAVVELPPMVVMETTKGPPWVYLKTPVGEYLSRCSVGTTREFAQADLKQFQMLRAFVPDSLNARLVIPALVVLDRLESKSAADSILADMTAIAEKRFSAERTLDNGIPIESRAALRLQTLLNLRLDDKDMNVLFAYLDEKNYDGRRMVLTPNYVRYLLEQRKPDLPSWFIEGVVANYERSNFGADPIAVRPFTWISRMETSSLVREPTWPRALLPMNELLAPDALRAETDHAPRRVAAWRSQTELFFRWAIDPQNDKRDALWKLVERATRDPVTEEMFIECFGFGFSEMRDRLSDYLPTAVKEPLRIDAPEGERVRIDEPRLAPRELTARILGEWQRLAIGYVAAKHPQFTEKFSAEARSTLRKAYDWGDREPQTLAAIGLCEIDAANPDGAPFYLKLAMEKNVMRPRAYYELGRIWFADLTRSQPTSYLLSAAETEAVIAPLRRALQQTPLMAEAVALYANVWLRSAAVPNERDLALLMRTAKVFPARPAMLFRIALVNLKCGRLADAQELLIQAMKFPVDDPMRVRLAEVLAAIARMKK